jgi:hypothetical protein
MSAPANTKPGIHSRVKEFRPAKNLWANMYTDIPFPIKYRREETPRLKATGTPSARHTINEINNNATISYPSFFAVSIM